MRRNDQPTDEPTTAGVLDRRSLLRRAGTVAALAGGAAVVQAAVSGTADAAAGDPAVLGANNAGTATTAITSASTGDATLNLANTGDTHGPLSLVDCTPNYSASTTKTTGELYADSGDLYWVDGVNQSGSFVYTETTANQVVGLKPTRMLDTRATAGRAFIVNPSVLDSAHRVIGLKWLQLDLSSLADFFESAFVNLTAVTPTAAGYLALSPKPPAGLGAPPTSNLNYGTATLANAAVVPTIDGSVWIYASRTTHVILDVTALNLPGANLLAPGLLPSVALKNNADRRAAFAQARAARAALK
jgi:hypothetical protein